MKKCKYCQMEIPKKARVCPNCKRTLKSHGCLVSIAVIILLFAGGTIAITSSLDFNDSLQKEISGVSDESEYITMEEFNKIENGMSYKKVCKIIGFNGELTSTAGSGEYVVEIYTWYGNGVAGSNANVTFQNGKVTGKAQVGLK